MTILQVHFDSGIFDPPLTGVDLLVPLEKVFLNEAHVTLTAVKGLLAWDLKDKQRQRAVVAVGNVSSFTVMRTGVNEDVSLQVVVGPEGSITVDADVTLGVLGAL